MELSEELLAAVLGVSSYEFMAKKEHAHHFDEHFVRSIVAPKMGLADGAPPRVSKVGERADANLRLRWGATGANADASRALLPLARRCARMAGRRAQRSTSRPPSAAGWKRSGPACWRPPPAARRTTSSARRSRSDRSGRGPREGAMVTSCVVCTRSYIQYTRFAEITLHQSMRRSLCTSNYSRKAHHRVICVSHFSGGFYGYTYIAIFSETERSRGGGLHH